MTRSTEQILHQITLGSYFALLLHLLLWITWLGPSHYFPTAMVLIAMLVPLLLPLRGLLHGNPYTHAWSGFLALFYFIHGVGDFFINPPERLYSGIEIFLSLSFFFSAAFYARFVGKRLSTSEGE
ncbi:MAG: DUF2069 domain-containing protein [Gammaproteobacteria bacterium]|jgi:uncharacterized membrane protein|nr:DUF2069 domain-containing protein [Gammaproteobacteria bacterium]MBT7307609.1 DUF2069 domain-containing protein [Gammaproteobacteria bacterium]